jgi:hypothetical protein
MLDLKLQPSRTLVFLLAMAHLLSLLVVWLLPLTQAVQIISSLLIMASFLFHLRRDGLLAASHSILQLRLDPECNCTYQTRAGAWREARLLSSSMATPWLSVLNLSPENSRLTRHIVIFPDSADAESRRKMRVLLRWKCGNASRA